MGLWNHIPPAEPKRTRNYGLAGGWLTPPTSTPVMVCPLCGGTGRLA